MRIFLLILLASMAALFACGDKATESIPTGPGGDSSSIRIFFSRSNQANTTSVLCRIDTDGSNLDSLTDADEIALEPNVASDGNTIAFSSNHFSSARDIVTMRYGDTVLTRLTSLTGIESDPCWAPNQSRILFTGQSNSTSNRNIYVINGNGTGLLALTASTADFHSPAWSHTASDSIYFIGPGGQVHMMNINDKGSIVIPIGLTDPAGIKFSPIDSTYLLEADIVLSSDSSYWHIFRGDFSGVKPTDISDPDMYDISPAWAPDGSKIVFRSNGFYEQEYDDGLFLADPNGSNRVKIPGTSTLDNDPCWAPPE